MFSKSGFFSVRSILERDGLAPKNTWTFNYRQLWLPDPQIHAEFIDSRLVDRQADVLRYGLDVYVTQTAFGLADSHVRLSESFNFLP